MISWSQLTPSERRTVDREGTRDLWFLVGLVALLIAVVGFTIGDPGDRTQPAACTSPAGVTAPGSGLPTVEPGAVCGGGS